MKAVTNTAYAASNNSWAGYRHLAEKPGFAKTCIGPWFDNVGHLVHTPVLYKSWTTDGANPQVPLNGAVN